MEIMHHDHHHCHFGIKLGFEIAKLVLKGAAVAAAFCAVKELHKVHKAVEAKKEK